MRMLRALPLVAALLAGTACYSFVPADRADPPQGRDVRVHVAGAAAERLGPIVRQSGSRSIDGRLLRWSRDTLVLEVSEQTDGSTLPGRRLVQGIRVPNDDVLAVEVRSLDRFRTVGLATLIAGAVAAAVVQALSGESGGTPNPRPPEPVELRLPAPAPPLPQP